MDYQLFWKPRFLLGEGMLVVDDFCSKMSIILSGVEMCQRMPRLARLVKVRQTMSE